MEAQIKLSTPQNHTDSSARFRTGLILAGIMVAIVGLIFLANDKGVLPDLTSWLPLFTANGTHHTNPLLQKAGEMFSSTIKTVIR